MTPQYNTQSSTHSSTAVFQENVDVFFVLKVVVKVHYVFMMEGFVQLDFPVNLCVGGRRDTVAMIIVKSSIMICLSIN